MTDTEKDARIAELQERVAALEERIENIAEALTFAPASSHWSTRLAVLLGTAEPVNNMHRAINNEYARGRSSAVNNMRALLNGMKDGAK